MFDDETMRLLLSAERPMRTLDPEPAPRLSATPMVPEVPLRMGAPSAAGMDGEALDALARVVLQATRDFRPRTDFEGFVSGLAGGLAGVRDQSAGRREAFEASQRQRAGERDRANMAEQEAQRDAIRKNASGRASHLWASARAREEDERRAAMDREQREWEAKQKVLDRAAYGNPRGGGGASGGAGDGEITDAEAVADGIYNRTMSPLLGNRMTKDVAAVQGWLRRKYPDFNLATAISDWNQKEKFNASQNSGRFIASRTATETVARHLHDFERLSAAYDKVAAKTPLRFVNKSVIDAAAEGWLGEEMQALAIPMQMTREVLNTETATLLKGGYAPLSDEVEAARKRLDNALRGGAQTAAFKAFKNIVRSRAKSAAAATPFSGAKTNPYLQDPTPLDVYDEVFGKEESGPSGGGPASDPNDPNNPNNPAFAKKARR